MTSSKSTLLPSLSFVWPVLILVGAALFFFLTPTVEFTSDDGAWILDAWLRLKEQDWFTPWISTSQGIKNMPLVSWFLMIPLAVWPSVTADQILLIGVQIITLLLTRKIALRIRMRWHGLLTASLILLLPALSLNYSSKICNVSFMIFASALLLWSRLCNRGWKRHTFLLLSFLFAIQVHYSFVIYLFPILLEPLWGRFQFRLKSRLEKGIAGLAVLLLVLSCLDLLDLPQLRSLMDLIVSGSPYMLARSVSVGTEAASKSFWPWELLPLFLALIALPGRNPFGRAPRRTLWSYLTVSLMALAGVSFFNRWSPHHWMLPWALPSLLLLEIGCEYIGRYLGNLVAVFVLIALVAWAGFQTSLVWSVITSSKGTGWHGPSLSTKRELMSVISKTYSHYPIVLAVPGAEWCGGLTGWTALASLPGEYLDKVTLSPPASGTLFLEERGSEGSFAGFSELARSKGWEPVFHSGDISLWKTDSPITGIWPRVRSIRHRRVIRSQM